MSKNYVSTDKTGQNIWQKFTNKAKLDNSGKL